MKKAKQLSDYRWFFVCAVFLTLLISMLWQLSTTFFSDDIPYRNFVAPDDNYAFWHSCGHGISSFGEAMQSVVNHFFCVNGRFTHFIYIPMQLLPHWVASAFAGLSMGMMFWGLVCVAVPSRFRNNIWILMTAVVLFWCAFPWYDTFQSAVYQVNYSTTSALVLLFMLWFARCGSYSRRTIVCIVVISVLIGWMHEGFTIPLLAYCAVSVLLDSRNLKRHIELATAAFSGLLFNLLGSTVSRAAEAMAASPFDNMPYLISRMMISLWPFWLSLVFVAVCCCLLPRRGLTCYLKRIIPLAAAAVTAIGIALVLVRIDRVLWPADFFSVIIILYSLRVLLHNRRQSYSGATVSVFVMMSVLYILWGFSLWQWQRKITGELDRLYSLAAPRGAKSHDTYFCDMTKPFETPFWLMQMPVHMLYFYPYDNMTIGNYYGHPEEAILILPESFSALSYGDWPDIPGDNGFKGEFPVFVSKDDFNGKLRLTFRELLTSATPLNSFAILLKEKSFDGSVEVIDNFNKFRVRLPDGDSAYYIMPNHVPRTAFCRRFVSVDTLSVY